jgi:hypothetical protein
LAPVSTTFPRKKMSAFIGGSAIFSRRPAREKQLSSL